MAFSFIEMAVSELNLRQFTLHRFRDLAKPFGFIAVPVHLRDALPQVRFKLFELRQRFRNGHSSAETGVPAMFTRKLWH